MSANNINKYNCHARQMRRKSVAARRLSTGRAYKHNIDGSRNLVARNQWANVEQLNRQPIEMLSD